MLNIAAIAFIKKVTFAVAASLHFSNQTSYCLGLHSAASVA